MKDSPEKRLQRARIALILDEPFFGSLLMHLKAQLTTTCPTFSTDGRSLRVNPDFMAKLNDAELNTILAHEVMHCALLHPYRRGDRDLKKFNRAADFAINNFLDSYNQHASAKSQRAPFVFTGPLKDGCLNHAYDKLSAEEIYNQMIDPPPNPDGQGGEDSQSPSQQGNPNQGQSQAGPPSSVLGPPSSPSSPGEFTDGAADEAAAQEHEADWKVALKQAAMAAKAHGKLPAEFARLIEEFLQPKASWRDILRTYLTSCCTDDYSWSRPNRRYAGSRSVNGHRSSVILPSLHSPRLGTVVVAVDTSGSVFCKAEEFFAEARSILRECRPEKLIFCQCDADVADWVEVQPDEDFPLREAKGGGGTDFRPVFERITSELTEAPAAVVYLTDLYGDFPDADPGYPVIWACINDQQAPFGKTISIE